MADLNSLAIHIDVWQAGTFPNSSPASAALDLLREAAELYAHYWVSENGAQLKRLGPSGTVQARAEEAADIFFMLVQVASLDGFNLADAVEKKLHKNMRRKWKAPDDHGVVEHED